MSREKDMKSLYKTLDELGITAMAEAKGEAKGVAIGEARGKAKGVTIGEARGKQQERKKWQTVVADKDAEIVRLRKQLEKAHSS